MTMMMMTSMKMSCSRWIDRVMNRVVIQNVRVFRDKLTKIILKTVTK